MNPVTRGDRRTWCRRLLQNV